MVWSPCNEGSEDGSRVRGVQLLPTPRLADRRAPETQTVSTGASEPHGAPADWVADRGAPAFICRAIRLGSVQGVAWGRPGRSRSVGRRSVTRGRDPVR